LLRERGKNGRIGLGAFYARALAAHLSLYYVVLALYACEPGRRTKARSWRGIFLHGLPFHATYTANWFLDYAVPHPVMFAFSWSLCVEEQFYWIWPGFVALLRSRVLLGCLMGGAVVVDTLASTALSRRLLPPGSLGLRMLTSFATPSAAARCWRCCWMRRAVFRLPPGCSAGAGRRRFFLLLSVGCLLLPATPYLSLSFSLAALVGAVAVRPDSGLSWLLERAFVRRLGTLSYAAYLLPRHRARPGGFRMRNRASTARRCF